MIFFNPDGTESMCGNGSKCAVNFAIKKGLSNNQFFEIKSDQITDSDNIIIEGKALVKDGMKVNISE